MQNSHLCLLWVIMWSTGNDHMIHHGCPQLRYQLIRNSGKQLVSVHTQQLSGSPD